MRRWRPTNQMERAAHISNAEARTTGIQMLPSSVSRRSKQAQEGFLPSDISVALKIPSDRSPWQVNERNFRCQSGEGGLSECAKTPAPQFLRAVPGCRNPPASPPAFRLHRIAEAHCHGRWKVVLAAKRRQFPGRARQGRERQGQAGRPACQPPVRPRQSPPRQPTGRG